MDERRTEPGNGDCGSPPGELRLGVAAATDLRWAAVDVARPLEDVRARLDLSPIAAVALGRALAAAALLLRFTVKTPGRLILEIVGDGPLGKVVAEVGSNGYLRGAVGEPRLPTPDDGRLSIAWAVGSGLFKVTRILEGGRYESQVALVSGEIGKDLVHYLEQSQQIHSAALLGVLPRPEGIVQAGGVLIEAFPGVAEETLDRLEQNIAGLAGVSVYLERGGLAALLDAPLAGFDREDLERHQLVYGCGQGREEVRSKLVHLRGDLDEIVDGRGFFSADCVYCGRRFTFSGDDLQPIN